MFERFKANRRQQKIHEQAQQLVKKYWVERDQLQEHAWKHLLVSDVLDGYPPEDQEDLISEAGRMIRARIEKAVFEVSMRAERSTHLMTVLETHL